MAGDEPSIGHNSAMTSAEQKKLKGIVQEIEYAEGQKRTLVGDIGAIYKRAKDLGFDTKAIRSVVRARRMEEQAREALEHTIDVYKHALGMLADLPLGQAALQQAAEEQTKKPHRRRSAFGDAVREANPGFDGPPPEAA